MVTSRLTRTVGIDTPLLVTALLLSALGIAMVYSAGQTDTAVSYQQSAWQRQLMWFSVSMVAAWMVTRSSVRLLEWSAAPAYALSLVLLLFTLLFGSGAGTARSMQGWLTIGGVRLGQPSELAKLTVVLMLAKVLASRRGAVRSVMELWQPLLVVGVPWLLIMAQPDLGTGIVFIGIAFGMMFWAGVPWPLLILLASPGISLMFAFSSGIWGAWFLVLLALIFWYRPHRVEGVALVVANVAIGVVAPLIWDRLKPYQQARLLVFLDPQYDPREAGYQVLQSLYAIGSGGLVGKGYTLGTQKRLGFLPAHHTDFIFSVVGEELGFLGVSIVLSLFLALFLRSTRVALRASETFGSLVAFGIVTGWFVHVVVNVGMTLNLMPITGIPLPFFSYGGSFLLASWLSVAVLLRISSEGRGAADGLGL
jgi:rod shape determining protein RodA